MVLNAAGKRFDKYSPRFLQPVPASTAVVVGGCVVEIGLAVVDTETAETAKRNWIGLASVCNNYVLCIVQKLRS